MGKEMLLQLRGIIKDFPGTRALKEVNLQVAKGEVHAVIGENGAGKSTLMNIIAGVFPQTAGTIEFEGKEVHFFSPLDAQKLGIGIVHQEISLCPQISVAENIYMGRLPKTKAGMVDYKKMHRECEELFKNFSAQISPKAKVMDLSIAEQQIVEIVRSLSLDCKLIILDEPTSSLTEVETRDLFKVVNHLREQGISVLYISHRLSEVIEICDRVSVYRDGEYVDTQNVCDINTDKMVSMMVGRTLESIYPAKSKHIAEEELLKVSGFSRQGKFEDISFSLRRGEILGFSGLIGAGRSEVARAICGIDPKESGVVEIKGKKVNIRDYKDAISKGLAYITEDRKGDGLFIDYNIKQNISAAALRKVKKGKLLDDRKETKLAEDYVKKIKIKVSSLKQLCSSLSGGNQQKVLFAKWLAVEPEILIIDEPTRGIDVGVRLEI
ncbi:MAG: sugar ABC transporter ATP-binding protein, partial [Christensenella hongkongensis]